MMIPTAPRPKSIPAWKSPWIIGWVMLVLVVLIVNIIFVVLGLSTNPGLVVEDFYDRGQDYEKTWASRQQHDPGWLLEADVPPDLVAGVPTVLRFFIVDKAGMPANIENAHFYAYRPSDVRRDFDLPMVEEGPGRYRVDVNFPLMGVWDTLVVARHGGEEFNLSRRISVPAPAMESRVRVTN